MLCIVILIIALIAFWWFTTPPIEEGFATPMPYMVLVGLTAGGAVYYADIDVPMQPKWILTNLTGIQDIAGSYGQLYTVSNGGSVPRYGAYDSASQNSMRGGSVTQISVDDANFVAGVNGTSVLYSSSLTGEMRSTTATAKSISLSGGIGYAVGADGKLYHSSKPSEGTWTLVEAATNWKQVSLDAGVVCAIKTDGSLWYADSNIEFPTTGITMYSGSGEGSISITESSNWKQNGSSGMGSSPSQAIIRQGSLPPGIGLSYISLKAGRLIGIGTDGILYYSNSYSTLSWSTVNRQPYNVTTGAATGSPVTFTKAILMYPRLDARRKRFLGTGRACNSNEELIGPFCYQTCPSGRPARGISCPYLAKYINAIPVCPRGTQFINNACYNNCPSGYSANGQTCAGATMPKQTKAKSTTVVPQAYSCPVDGSVSGRYIRVRPTTLITNNKLCIKKLVVKDSAGKILSGLTGGSGGSGSSSIKATATDGSCADIPIGGTSCPLRDTYLSGATYDRDSDAGKKKRASELYWELDLGSIQNIKTIEFTGCSYQSSTSTGNSGSAVAGADQITGMRIEVLYNTNLSTTPPKASRTLGAALDQTLTFNYVISKMSQRERCFDTCPPINGVNSLDQGDDTCMVASGGITHRAVSVPMSLPDPVCGPPLRPDGTVATIPALRRGESSGASIQIGNWVTDPSNSSYQLSCDILPGSTLQPLNSSFIIPSKGFTQGAETNLAAIYSQLTSSALGGIGRAFSFSWATDIANALACTAGANCPTPKRFETNWTVGGGAYSNSDTPFVCVLQTGTNAPTCPAGYVYSPAINACELNRTQTRQSHSYQDGFHPVGVGQCILSGFTECQGAPRMITTTVNSFAYNISQNNEQDNYKKPICTEGVNIAKPQRVVSQCRCLNPDNTLNKSAFIYNGKCVKCSSPRDVFYATGESQNITWSDEQRGSIVTLSRTTEGTLTTIQDTHYYTLEDAKNTCESMLQSCKGITRYTDDNGTYYKLGTSGVETSGAFANNTCWSMNTGTPSIATTGRYTGKLFSSDPIPRAFADNYKSSNPRTPPTNLQSPQEILDMYSSTSPITSALSTSDMSIFTNPINFLRNSLGQAAAFASFAQSVERPDTYYSLTGMERRIQANIGSSTDNYGICVGPCDPEHPLQDPIQMLHSTVETPNLYVLYGTTCHDSTQTVIDQPSIPAVNTPASGDLCPTESPIVGTPIVYEYDGTRCVAQCPHGTTDNKDGTCTTSSIPRSYVTPSYSCPDRTHKKVDTVCVFPCEGNDRRVGEYCEPSQSLSLISTLGSGSSAIKCTKTPYAYSSKYQKSAQAPVNKWLCDSQEDLTAILAGHLPNSGTTFYVNENDVVCMADDASTGMYFCQSVNEAVNQVQGTERENNTTVCNNLTSAYYDLSNNLDILSSTSVNAKNASFQMISIQATLQNVYKYLCPSGSGSGSGSSSTMCRNLSSQLNALSVNINAGSGATASVLTPIQIALSSRDTLVAQMSKFQCNY